MNKKQRTIKACKELARKDRNPRGETFFNADSCPLCPIHHGGSNCQGCPLARKGGLIGCYRFKTYIEAKEAKVKFPDLSVTRVKSHQVKNIKSTFNARATFFDKIIPILERIPASRFTKKGWRYFEELGRDW